MPAQSELAMGGGQVMLDSDATSFDKEQKQDVPQHVPEMDTETLAAKVREAVEQCLSLTNLQNEGAFLASQMNSNMFVPLAILAQVPSVAVLTTDVNIIAESIKDSTAVTLGEDGVKPNIRVERNTIILREIPSATPEETIRGIFLWEGCPAVKSVRRDVKDTWFVTMESEEDAKNTLQGLSSATFEGKPIRARLKSESVMKTLLPAFTRSGSTSSDGSGPPTPVSAGVSPHFSPHGPHGGFFGNGSGGPFYVNGHGYGYVAPYGAPVGVFPPSPVAGARFASPRGGFMNGNGFGGPATPNGVYPQGLPSPGYRGNPAFVSGGFRGHNGFVKGQREQSMVPNGAMLQHEQHFFPNGQSDKARKKAKRRVRDREDAARQGPPMQIASAHEVPSPSSQWRNGADEQQEDGSPRGDANGTAAQDGARAGAEKSPVKQLPHQQQQPPHHTPSQSAAPAFSAQQGPSRGPFRGKDHTDNVGRRGHAHKGSSSASSSSSRCDTQSTSSQESSADTDYREQASNAAEQANLSMSQANFPPLPGCESAVQQGEQSPVLKVGGSPRPTVNGTWVTYAAAVRDPTARKQDVVDDSIKHASVMEAEKSAAVAVATPPTATPSTTDDEAEISVAPTPEPEDGEDEAEQEVVVVVAEPATAPVEVGDVAPEKVEDIESTGNGVEDGVCGNNAVQAEATVAVPEEALESMIAHEVVEVVLEEKEPSVEAQEEAAIVDAPVVQEQQPPVEHVDVSEVAVEHQETTDLQQVEPVAATEAEAVEKAVDAPASSIAVEAPSPSISVHNEDARSEGANDASPVPPPKKIFTSWAAAVINGGAQGLATPMAPKPVAPRSAPVTPRSPSSATTHTEGRAFTKSSKPDSTATDAGSHTSKDKGPVSVNKGPDARKETKVNAPQTVSHNKENAEPVKQKNKPYQKSSAPTPSPNSYSSTPSPRDASANAVKRQTVTPKRPSPKPAAAAAATATVAEKPKAPAVSCWGKRPTFAEILAQSPAAPSETNTESATVSQPQAVAAGGI